MVQGQGAVQGAEGLKGGYCQPAVREAWARMVQEKGSEVDRLKIHRRKNRQEMAMDCIRKIRKGCGFNLSNCVGNDSESGISQRSGTESPVARSWFCLVGYRYA